MNVQYQKITLCVLVTTLALAAAGCESPTSESDDGGSSTADAQPALNDTGVDVYVIDTDYSGNATYTASASALPAETHASPPSGFPDNQDAALGADATANDDSDGAKGFRFVKLSESGEQVDPATPWSDSNTNGPAWGCVVDLATGLVWEVKRNASTSPRHWGWRFSWYDDNAPTNGGSAGLAGGGSCGSLLDCDTQAYAQHVNAMNSGAGLCGLSGWRLPSREEVRSIVDYSVIDAAFIDQGFFPMAETTDIWTSQSAVSDPSRAWTVHLERIGAQDHPKDEGNVTRLVTRAPSSLLP